MTPAQLSAELNRQAESVCKFLLPNGKKFGHHWEAGDVSGCPGQSLKVVLSGEKVGVWSDFHTGEVGGDLLDLWRVVMGISLFEAMQQSQDHLGIRQVDGYENRPQRSYKRPERPRNARKLNPMGKVYAYLKSRCLNDETLDDFQIGEQDDKTILFPYKVGNELINTKYLDVERVNGKKKILQETGAEPVLFGWQALNKRYPNTRIVTLTEGECFPGSTEILTENGWISLDHYQYGRVAQWDNGVISFVYPLAKIEKEYSGDLVRYEQRGYLSITTPQHNMIAIDRMGRFYKHKAIDGSKSSSDHIPRCGICEGEGIELTYEQIALCIAVSADAAIDTRKMSYAGGPSRKRPIESRYARFGFKKQRKIDRLRLILSECGIIASDTEIASGYRSICFGLPDWVPGRILPNEWISQATLEQREFILDELIHWDGNSVQNRTMTEYSSKYKENVDFVQAICFTSGRCSSIISRKNDLGEWYKASILNDKTTSSWQKLKERRKLIHHKGRVYCVKVPSGAILIRQEDKVSVSGNCDAMTYHQLGIPALSIPNGGGKGEHKQDWIENDYERLNRFDTFFISMDQDDAGKEAEKEIIRRLGSERCRVVKLPAKDANECLMKGLTQFNKYLIEAKSLDPIELKPADYFIEEVVECFFPKPGTYQGMKTPWNSVNEAIRFNRAELVVWSGYSGSGKALALDTPIATPEGWSNIGSIDVGDQVFDENGFVCNVVARTDIMLNRHCYKVIFSDGCEIIADENHEWLTDTIQSRQSEAHARRNNRDSERPLKKRGRDQSGDRRVKTIVTTKMIANTLVAYRGKDCSGVCVNHSIDVAGALILPHRDLPIDPYLLGVWLGDGTSQGAAITTADMEIVDEIVKVGFVVNKYASKYGYGIVGGFKKSLDDNGLTNNKHIPDEYMRASYSQRLALMQGLMDTDGYVSDNGRCEFCSTNKELGYQVLELSRTLGIRSYMVLGRAKLYGKDCGAKYRVMFSTDIPVFRLSRKSKNVCKSLSVGTKRRYIVSCESVDSVPVRCIQVDSDSHLYLAGKSMIPTHNSQILGQVSIQGITQGERFVICSLEMPAKQTLARMARQIIGSGHPTEAQVRAAILWLRDKCWIVNIVGKMKTERILEVFRYAAKRYDIHNFILDSLTKCNIREDDYDAQKVFVDELCDFNHAYEATTHLVVHQRKPSGNNDRPDKFGARGAAAITDEASSVICVWRPSHEDEDDQNDSRFNTKKKSTKKDHNGVKVDCVLSIDKNRERGIEGRFNLFFDPQSLQFHETPQAVPIDYITSHFTRNGEDDGTF